MKNHVIKALVVVLGLSLYFNVSQIFEIQTLENNQELLQENIEKLETRIDELTDQLNNHEEDDIIDTCNKLYEITIQIISTDDEVDTSYTHCTNKALLGEALEEVETDLEVVFTTPHPQYGRMLFSIYGIDKVYEEYFAITINGVYSDRGLDFVQLEDGSSYEFTLTRWG